MPSTRTVRSPGFDPEGAVRVLGDLEIGFALQAHVSVPTVEASRVFQCGFRIEQYGRAVGHQHPELFSGGDVDLLIGDLLSAPVVEAAEQQQVEEHERKRDGPGDAGQRSGALPASDALPDFPQDFIPQVGRRRRSGDSAFPVELRDNVRVHQFRGRLLSGGGFQVKPDAVFLFGRAFPVEIGKERFPAVYSCAFGLLHLGARVLLEYTRRREKYYARFVFLKKDCAESVSGRPAGRAEWRNPISSVCAVV